MNDNNPFANQARDLASRTTTENGAIARRHTTNPLVDLFGVIGALREDVLNGSFDRLCRLIDCAYHEDKTLLAKMIFYLRDVRGGLGERETFRAMICYCAEKYPEVIESNIKHIPEYGRWDDVLSLIGTPLEEKMWDFVKRVFDEDLYTVNTGGKNISLLAKWLPSADASSENTRKKGCYVAKKLGKTVYEYKRDVKAIRRVINTIESHISAKDWGTYDYSKVPSNAMLKYSNAFRRNDGERYAQYIADVSKGKASIHSATLFPSDIIRRLRPFDDNSVCQELWNALPNYVEGENNYLVMADVSGSMTGVPMDVSIGLALYFAERNKGPFKNLFMTFSANPLFVEIPEHYSLYEKYRLALGADWGYDTNLESAFRSILNLAKSVHATQDELPKSLIIITDMEFDRAMFSDKPFFDEMKDRFAEAGYEMPNVVFWNVDSRHDTYHAKADEPRVQLVSGKSPSTFKLLIEGLNKTPYELMLQALSDKRYDPITAA